MKNLDVTSKRILSVGVAISMILLCGSLFLLALDNLSIAKAKPFNETELTMHASAKILNKHMQDTISGDMDEDIFALQAFGLGIREGQLYFGILYNNNTIGLHRAQADGEDVLPW